MKTPASKLSRRNFLLAVGAGGVATAAAVVASKSPQTQPKKAEAVTRAKGYHAHRARPQVLQHRQDLREAAMLLTRKSTSVSANRRAQSRLTRPVAGMLGRTIDRRTFLQRSGIALGAGAVAVQLPFSIVGEAQAAQDAAPARSKSSARSARTARSAARSTPSCRTACGSGRSRCSIRRSTSARTARRAPRSASTA